MGLVYMATGPDGSQVAVKLIRSSWGRTQAFVFASPGSQGRPAVGDAWLANLIFQQAAEGPTLADRP